MDRRKIDIRYLAGFVDGEGCISIHVNRSRAARHANQAPRVVMQLIIVNTDVQVLRDIRKQFGGCLRPNKNIKTLRPEHKLSYSLTFSEQAGAVLAKQLLPYLRIKNRQARLMLQLAKLKRKNGRKRITEKEIQKRLAIVTACKGLNRRGR